MVARKKRIWEPGYFYHIVCCGNRRDALFIDHSDFNMFLQMLEKVAKKTPFDLAAYCLMTNHFHLQIQSNEHPTSKVMA
ncbi:transposase [Virgibacillus byunsanensis]|uniref:Transposase n=1 Tax=Virgibacillus byunsanensis TaxID=570945 RepID=A0ABW3LGI3_9BACI